MRPEPQGANYVYISTVRAPWVDEVWNLGQGFFGFLEKNLRRFAGVLRLRTQRCRR